MENDVYRRVGRRLRALRISHDLNQAQVAALLDVSPQQYAKYEDAKTRCTLAVVLTLATHYGVGVETIVSETATEPMALRPAAEPSGDEDLLSRLVSAYLSLPDPTERMRVVERIEAARTVPA